jgi:chemotaxis signal transduction protein
MRVFYLEWFAFKAADEYFGIDARHVYRVVEDDRIASVPLAPPCHLGLVYYRGEMFDVIDIVSLLGKRKAGMKDNFRIILVKWSDKKLALVPDGIVGLLWIEDGKDTDTVYVGGNYTARLVTPEYIWSTLLKLPYGPDKI